MGKQHLDFLALIAGPGKGRCACQRSGNIAGILMDIARDFPRWRVRAAILFERARIAIRLAGPVEPGSAIMHLAGRLKDIARRADIDIALPIPENVAAISVTY